MVATGNAGAANADAAAFGAAYGSDEEAADLFSFRAFPMIAV